MTRLIFELIDPNYICVDLIKSKVYPDINLIKNWLDEFARQEISNYDLSDLAEEYEDSLVKLYKKQLNFSGQLRLIYYKDHQMNLQEYRNTLDWAVMELLYWTNFRPILISEVPFIRELLNAPVGQEEKSLQRWQEYWYYIDFKARLNMSRM